MQSWSKPKSLAMCFTSTGAALSLPPKKKDIYRPYSLEDKPNRIRVPDEKDLHAAHAILDLSATPVFNIPQNFHHVQQDPTYQDNRLQILEDYENQARNYNSFQETSNIEDSSQKVDEDKPDLSEFKTGKTVAYTYEAFFVSDGRSKRAREKADQKPDNRLVLK